MTLAPDKEGFRYTRYRWEEVFSLLIERSERTGVSVIHAAPEQGRRITIHIDLPVENNESEQLVEDQKEENGGRMVGDRVAVLLGKSSDWYKYRLNVFARQEGIEWVVCGTHDTCVSVPVWSVEEERLYGAHETRIPFSDLLTRYQKLRRTSFGHNLMLGGMICNVPEAKEVALSYKRSFRYELQAEVRKHAHKRKGPQLKIG